MDTSGAWHPVEYNGVYWVTVTMSVILWDKIVQHAALLFFCFVRWKVPNRTLDADENLA